MRYVYVKRDGIGSLLIRAFEGGVASHVAMVLTDGSVVDATLRHGVHRWASIDDWIVANGYTIVDDITLALRNESAAEAWVLAQVGKGYDWTALIGFLLWRDLNERARWYCSELGLGALLSIGFEPRAKVRRCGVRLLQEMTGALRAGGV